MVRTLAKATARIAASLFAILSLTGLLAPRAQAVTILQPAALTVMGVFAYQNTLVPSDQLYVIDYTINYSTADLATMLNTGRANGYYLVRLMNGTTLIQDMAAISIYRAGYCRNIALIYIAAPTVTWATGTVGVRVDGNPLATTWAGGTVPTSGLRLVDRWSSFAEPDTTRSELTRTLKDLLLSVQADLSSITLDSSLFMAEAATGGIVLTPAGQSYLGNQLYYILINGQTSNGKGALKVMAPGLFEESIVRPEVSARSYSGTYANSLVTDLAGTPLDFSTVATKLNTSPAFVGVGLFLIVFLVAARWLTKKGFNPKLIITLGCFGLVFGSFFLLPMALAIGLGVFAVIFIGFILFYRGSGT